MDKMVNWSEDWLLKFNKEKCKHLHLGRGNAKTFTIEGREFTKTTEEKALGVIIDHHLKFQKHMYRTLS